MAVLMFNQIKSLHLYDCLRANKSTSAWGVEARVPFLDKEFINIAMSIDPEWKMVMYRTSEFWFYAISPNFELQLAEKLKFFIYQSPFAMG